MKHTFKVGDGMTTENSTAEERMEIWHLLCNNGHKTYLGETKRAKSDFIHNLYFGKDILLCLTAYGNSITNPLTYEHDVACLLP